MKNFLILFTVLLIAACGGVEKDSKNYPMDAEDARRERRGRLTGEDGLQIFGGKDDDDGDGGGIGVNSFLWRATLDTLSFMPMSTTPDPFGGVIVTDWYEDPNAPGERFKINAYILSEKLRSDGIRVSVFRQKLEQNIGWRDQKVADSTAREIENTILTRARQLRIKQTGK